MLRAGVGYGYGVERCHPGPGRGQAEQFPPRNAQGCGAGGRHYSRHVRRTACTPGLSQVSQLASPKLNLDPAHCGLVHHTTRWKRTDLNGLRVRVRVGAGLLWLYSLYDGYAHNAATYYGAPT